MGNKLYVGNLSYNTTEETLSALFSEAGAVSEVAIMMDRMTNRPRGFAFVTMASNEEAQKAASMFNGREVDGRPIVVNEAKPMVPREGGFGGGGGGSRGGFGGGGGRGDRGGRGGRGDRGGRDRGDRGSRF
jgi:RNA recognition motif-containing protein